MIYALIELERISSALGVPPFLREEAAKMLREIRSKIHSSEEVKKKSHTEVLTASFLPLFI